MGPVLAYSPALALIVVGILAVAWIPPVEQPLPCNCPTSNQNLPVCSCAHGYLVNALGATIFLVAACAALVYALVVRSWRRRAARANPS